MKVTVLSGGVGGAKLCYGLHRVLPNRDLTIIVNTGDDMDFYGLYVSPDTDSVLYALADIEGERGWGIRQDTFHAINALRQQGEDIWFQIGDRDLATHLRRTWLLRQGLSLSQVNQELCRGLGIGVTVKPMSNDTLRTWIISQGQRYDFQTYMVKWQAKLRVEQIVFSGSDTALPAPGVIDSILKADMVLLAPSNPFVSIGAILAVSGIRQALCHTKAQVGAVSPIVAGRALKGPAADMLRDAGLPVSPLSVSNQYRDFLDLFIADQQDISLAEDFRQAGQQVYFMDTLMPDSDSKICLAKRVLEAMISLQQ